MPLFSDGQNAIFNQNGRGNNWALGYSSTYREKPKTESTFSTDNETTLYEKVMEMLRVKAERADFYRGTLLFHSLAGGTGSGLGSRLIESYRDYFGSSSYLMTVSIWPTSSGETPL